MSPAAWGSHIPISTEWLGSTCASSSACRRPSMALNTAFTRHQAPPQRRRQHRARRPDGRDRRRDGSTRRLASVGAQGVVVIEVRLVHENDGADGLTAHWQRTIHTNHTGNCARPRRVVKWSWKIWGCSQWQGRKTG